MGESLTLRLAQVFGSLKINSHEKNRIILYAFPACSCMGTKAVFWKPGTKEMLDDMHLRKIDLADEIFVINFGGYIGESTRSEIAYAEKTGKKVRYLEE